MPDLVIPASSKGFPAARRRCAPLRSTQLHQRCSWFFANLADRGVYRQDRGGQHRYYEQQVAQGADDYYTGRGEVPGEWRGAGAQALGLSGRVSGGQFNALVAGMDPRDPSARLRWSVA